MIRRLFHPAILVFVAGSPLCWGQSTFTGPASGSPSREFGLIFTVEANPQIPSLCSYADDGYSGSVGFGLNFSGYIQSSIQIYVGMQKLPPGSVKPVDGWVALGGASLEGTCFFTCDGEIRPFASVGYGLYTLGGGGGYNGGGPHLEAGAEWNFAEHFAFRGGARYAAIRFHDPTGPASQALGFEPFTARYVGATFRLTFYPNVFP